ncbi:sugar ABC transporter substrate-binding protein [Diplocloster agilis]|uniref:Sugar ABC transporter substrate-binding protein n=1 Tax=Diplocloster agilis TaxID=2850323 RepID=A0A949JUN6_9FIRM|nr:sugar ABC transporter substrate-binding protein [Diplocloster agilis]MBU9735455.1 sugar ABC transporter substrate-binding protein [Diplocloster agilis]
MFKRLFALFMAVMLTLAAAGCAGQKENETAPAAASESTETEDNGQDQSKTATDVEKDNGDMTIGVSICSLFSPYYVGTYNGITATAEQMGVELVTLMADDDINKQNEQMRNLISQKVDAIICIPLDGTSIAVTVQEAMDAGIPVIMCDRAIEGAKAAKSVVADTYQMGKDIIQWFVDDVKEEDKITEPYQALLLLGSLGDSATVKLSTGFKEVIAEHPDIIEIVGEVPTEWNQETALKGMQNWLQSNPEINMIIVPSDLLIPSVQSALQQVNRWHRIGEEGHVVILSSDGDSAGMQVLKDGYSEVDGAFDAVDCGVQSVIHAVKILNGEEEADDGQIVYGATLATYKNVEETGPSIWSWDDVE